MKKFFFSLILIITAVFATENQKAIIIFDASGSMWGQIDGKAKIEIARDALKNVINEWNPKVQLGLTVYGHRKKGDCNDIESLIPVGEIDKKKVISTVFAIKPKGKTPISRSIKKAAEELKYTEEKATIILISDGKETCDTNPCGVAKELKEKGIDFVTHVIGFNVDKKTDKQLKCIATATGGEYFSAKNASALNKAIKAIAKKVEKIEPTPTPTKKHTPKVLKNNLEVTASEKEGGKWIRAYISNIKTVDGKNVASGYDTYKNKPHEFKFPIGKYTLDMSYNKFKKTKIPFEIKAGEVTKLHIIMGQTGIVEVTASEKEGGKWIRAYISNIKTVDGKNVASGYDTYKNKPHEFRFPVGKYTLDMSYNKFKKTKIPFEIKAGEVTKLHIIMGQTGIVEVTASEKEGGKWIRAYISNIRTKDDKYIASGYDTYKNKPHEFRFPVGKYTLDMSYNKFKKTKIPFEIKAGEVTKLHIVMGETGVVEVTASEKEGGKWVRAYISNIRTKDGEYVNSGYDTYKNKPHEFRFPIGKYTLDMSYKEFKKTKIPFEIKAGKVTKLHVSFAPLHLSVKGTHKCAMVSYEVISAKGRVVTEKQAPANKGLDLVLPNGTYFIESTINGVTKKTKIVVGGENATKEAIIDFGGKDTKDGINGEWRLGSQKVIIHLNGTKVTGTIANGDNHRFKGEMTYPQRFNGFWIENGSNEKCSTTKQGSYYWGKVTWEFEDDMCSFTGKWNYCTKKPTMNGGKFIFIKPLPKEPTKEELIKADTPSKTQIAEEKHQKEDTKSNTEELDIKGVSQKDLENAKKLIDTLGGLFGNPNNSK